MKLVIADETQKCARDRLTFASWGARLTPEQYCLREQRLRQHPWARGAFTTWLLCDGGEVVSSCETFRMTSSSRSRPGSTHGVASVFTEPALRGRGHASALMKLLMRTLPERSPASTPRSSFPTWAPFSTSKLDSRPSRLTTGSSPPKPDRHRRSRISS